jgi:WD40 repeat protein
MTCHSGAIKDGKLDMSTYNDLIKGGKNKGAAIIVPGKKENSWLYKVSGRTEKPFMPPPKEEAQTPLSPEELALIGLWIDRGAISNGLGIQRTAIEIALPPANVQPVRAIAISPDKAFVAASRGNQIHIYEGAKGEFVRTLFDNDLKLKDKQVKASHISLVESLVYSPDGKYLVSGSFKEISIWDGKTGELKKKITGFAHEVVSLAFSQEGKILATGGGSPTEDGEVKFFAVDAWNQLGEIKAGHSDTVYGLCFSPESFEVINDKKEKVKFGLMIATCSADKFVKIWDVPSGKFVKSFEGHTHHVLDVGWSADGKLLASAGGDNTVKVWDFEKGEQARTIKAHDKQVTRLLFIGKKMEALTCGGDAQVKIFNVTNGGVVKTFAGNTDFIYAIGASPDGALIAAGGQEGGVRLYNGTTGALVRNLLPPDAQPPMKVEEKKK